MIEAGLISAVALFLVLARFNLKRICGYRTFIDVAATSIFVWMFIGTYAGMMTGILAGACVSLMLNIMTKLYGYERAHLVRERGHLLPTLVWQATPGRLS